MKLLIVTCPVVQIFQEVYQDQLVRNPQLIHKPEGIPEIVIPRSAGTIKFRLGIPQPLGGPRGSDKSQDLLGLADWLCGGGDGGMNQETDCYGVADLGLDEEATQQIMEEILTASMSGKKAQFANLGADIKKRMDEAMANARRVSEARIMREVRRVHSYYEDQLRRNKEQNMAYHPSKSEWLCRWVLKGEIAKREAERDEFKKQLDAPLTTDFLGVAADG